MINSEMKAKTGTGTALNRPQSEADGKPNPPQGNHTETNKRAILAPYPQITRQFDLMKASVERCKRDYPDCFHHKQQTAKECRTLADNLKAGNALLGTLAKIRPDSGQAVKKAINANRYLIRQLESVIEEVRRIEQESE